MQNTIIIELCEEDRARLDALREALVAAAPVEEAPEAEAPVEDDPETESATEESEAKVTLKDLRQMILSLTPEGKKKAQAIVKTYAESVPNIPEDKYAEVLEKLKRL